MDQAVETRLLQADRFQKLRALRRLELRNLALEERRRCEPPASLPRQRASRRLLCKALPAARAASIDVRHVKLRLHGDEEEFARRGTLIVGEIGGASGLARLEHLLELEDSGGLRLDLRILRVPRQLFDSLSALLHRIEIGEHQLRVDHLNIV